MTVAHAKVVNKPDIAGYDVLFSDWDAAHTISLTAADVTMTVRSAAGVPTGAPSGSELPIAFDTTTTTGGLYVWTGAAWVLAAPIPPVLTPG